MEGLKQIVYFAEQLVDRQNKIKELEAGLKAVKKEALQIEREDLPTAMMEHGISEIALESGERIEIKDDCDAKITDTTRGAALTWLNENGFGGLIKVEVALPFGRGDRDEAMEVFEDLVAHDYRPTLREDVHHSTLKAFVKEQLEKGAAIPMDLFNVFPYSKAVIVERKK